MTSRTGLSPLVVSSLYVCASEKCLWHFSHCRSENVARRSSGEEPLPEEDPNNPIFKTLPEPSRLDSYLITNQISHYCSQVNGYALFLCRISLIRFSSMSNCSEGNLHSLRSICFLQYQQVFAPAKCNCYWGFWTSCDCLVGAGLRDKVSTKSTWWMRSMKTRGSQVGCSQSSHNFLGHPLSTISQDRSKLVNYYSSEGSEGSRGKLRVFGKVQYSLAECWGVQLTWGGQSITWILKRQLISFT